MKRKMLVKKVGEYRYSTDITVKEAVDQWLIQMDEKVSDTSLNRYRTLLANHVLPVYGDSSIRCLTETELNGFSGNLSENLADRTVSYIINTVRRVRDNQMADDYSERKQTKQTIGRERMSSRKRTQAYETSPEISESEKYLKLHTLSDIEAKRLSSVLKRDISPTNLGILMCLHEGLRLGEMCALRREDFSDGMLEVNRTIQRVTLREADEHGKKTKLIFTEYEKNDSRHRTLPITDVIQEVLQSDMIVDCGCIITDDGEKPIDSRTMENRLKKILEALRIREANFNSLRDTFAVHCIDQGMDVATISRLLGHTDVGVTGNRYGEYLKDYQERQLAGVKLAGWG